MRTRYRWNGERWAEVGGDDGPRETGPQVLSRSEVCMASNVLPRWDADHKAAGGDFTPEGKPIITSRHQAKDYASRSAGEHDTFWEFGDIDRL